MHPIENNLKIIVEESERRGYSNLLIRNMLKEYLQDIVLYIIYSDKYLKDLTFYGGTCLRKVYGINRLSEDLDFETLKSINLNYLSDALLKYFRIEKFDKVSSSIQKSEHMNRCILKFEVLHSLGLTDKKNEKLHVKVEIKETDKKYEVDYTPYEKDIYSMVIKHYPLPVLMSTKILACTQRIFKKGNTGVNIKGRDFYDLIWYMQKGIIPDEDVFKKNNTNKKDMFNKLDNIVEGIRVRDLLLDLESLFESDVYIKDWCNNFHSFYKKYREIYIF
jgi:predicted nucleotidyltransferase component of viral defense system